MLLSTLGCGNPNLTSLADRGGQRSPDGSAQAGRSISSEDGHRDDAHIRRIRATVGADQRRSTLRRLSGCQRVFRPRPGRPWVDQARFGPSLRRGSLVLAVYHELGDKVHSLDDLTKPEVKKIALANPATAPYGKAGKQALERAGFVGRARAEDRRGRVGTAGPDLRAKGRRRGRPGRPGDRRRPRDPGPSRSTRNCTTPSSRHSGSWRPPHGPRTPSNSRGSSWTRRDRAS